MSQNNIQIIGQGTYGCVYRPNIDCQTKKIDSKQYLSKIQRKDKTSKNEIKIGKKIISLPKQIYSNRFAPILESCPIEIGKMEEQQFSTCKMIVQGKEKIKKTGLLSNKIQYIGEHTLGDYLEEQLSSQNTKQYLKKVAETHIYLLKSLETLNQINVLHLDLKHNNIMFDEKKGLPIIIDFGLSYNSENLDMSNYKVQETKFGITTDFYIPWTLETILLCHVAKYLSPNPKQTIDDSKIDQKITNTKMLESIVKNYVKKHGLLQSRKIFSEEEVKQYEKNMLQWVSSFKEKTWRNLWTSLSSSNKTWDSYSLSVLYIIELQISGLLQLSKKEETTFLTKYVTLLKQSILSKPEDRLLPSEIRKQLYIIFTQANKMNYKQIVKKFSNTVQENGEKIAKNRVKENLQTLQEEKQIHEKFNAR